MAEPRPPVPSPAELPAAASPLAGVALVCPRCRRVEAGQLVRHHLVPHPAGLTCPGCGEVYPALDGTPVVVRDVDAWLAAEAPALVCRTDLGPALARRVAQGAGGPLSRDHHRAALRALRRDSPLLQRVRALRSTLPGPVVDLGCGAGPAHRDGGDRDAPPILGVDLHWHALQEHAGPRLLADALDPPFEGGAFGSVLALNLLDSCRDPWLLLQQADALLRPGGRLVLSSPLCWQPDVTPQAAWLEAGDVDAFLARRGYRARREEADWTVPLGLRSEATHRCLLWVADKPEAAPSAR